MKFLSIPLLLLAVACGGADAGGKPAANGPTPTAAAASGAAAGGDKATAKAEVDPACLEHADAADGATDKVVHKCPNCGLGMDGKAEHATQIAGYELHSCSEGCKASLEKNPAGVLARSCKK